MTVATTAALVTLAGNGATTVFNYNFIIPFLSDGVTPAAQVYYTDLSGIPVLLSPSTYTFLGAGNPAGGSVTYPLLGSAIPAGAYISIIRNVPYTQPISFPNQNFFPSTIEALGDMIVEQIQQLVAEDAFVMRFPETDPTPPADLPPAGLRKNKLLGFDASGATALYAIGGSSGPVTFVTVSISHGNSPYTPGVANLIFVDASAGDVHINIPTAATIAPLFILRKDNSSHVVYLDALGGQTVNGLSSYPMFSQNQSVTLLPDGGAFWGIF